jgi:hydroxymethylglutaryl-CoA lyase
VTGSSAESVEIVDVGLRDGFQGIGPFIPTKQKIEFLHHLYAAGIRRMEITSFVSAEAVPQLSDATSLLAAAKRLDRLKHQVLVPNERYGNKAMEAGADFLAFVVSVSDSHNRSNVRRSPKDSVQEYSNLVMSLRTGMNMRLNVATAFDCPFEGRISSEQVIELLDVLVAAKTDAEICLCDTTGKATPDQVKSLFAIVRERYPKATAWAMHAHDTYGLGLANSFAAFEGGVRILDAAFAGLGGCPFAPGATGNTATEDLVWLCERMGVRTGVNLVSLVDVARSGARIPGSNPGGRAREALSASCRIRNASPASDN